MVKSLTLLYLLSLFGFAIAHTYNHQKVFKTPLGVPYQGTPIEVNSDMLNTKKVPFIEHIAGNASWLAMNFDFQYVKPIFDSLNSTEIPLLTRGESHITVISPPEFAILATAGIIIDEVNDIALQSSIQSSKVKLLCLGKEDVLIEGNRRIVYQIIAESPDLVKIRKRIFQLFVQKGGNTALFDPESFWPHITIGFTSGDVFVEQGIYKGTNVCFSRIRMKKH